VLKVELRMVRFLPCKVACNFMHTLNILGLSHGCVMESVSVSPFERHEAYGPFYAFHQEGVLRRSQHWFVILGLTHFTCVERLAASNEITLAFRHGCFVCSLVVLVLVRYVAGK
jgi:hypothetical protein